MSSKHGNQEAVNYTYFSTAVLLLELTNLIVFIQTFNAIFEPHMPF